MADSTTIATAADYADAMLTARRAKNWLFLFLLVILLAQLTVFALYRLDKIAVSPSPVAARAAATAPTTTAAGAGKIEMALRYLIGLTDFLGIVLAVVLALVILLVVNIMLVGRLIGVSRLTSAYILTLLLIVLLFPWQAFLGPDWEPVGALYTWDELIRDGRWHDAMWQKSVLKWWRFVGMPVLAIVILCMVQVKSRRGIRQSLGEADTSV